VSTFPPESVLIELRRSYVLSLSEKLTELSEAIADRRLATVSRLGHQLKGSGKSYGYPEISELGARMEEAADNRVVTQLESLLVEFERATQHIVNDLMVTEHP
jgi:HPt (histidine-containing phosphotransfer) domain-containing protein